MEDIRGELADPQNGAVENSLAALDAQGVLQAYAWALPPRPSQVEYRIDLQWAASIELIEAGVGDFLLGWMEACAGQSISLLAPGDLPAWLSLWCYNEREDLLALYARHGFQARHSEVFMHRDLGRPIAPAVVPQGVELLPWTRERDELMRQAYIEGFRDRNPQVEQGVPPAYWRRYFTGGANFYPPLSFIATSGGQGVGFTRCLIDREENARSARPTGEIAHIAVRPGWRRRGLAGALLDRVLLGFRELGLEDAVLAVDVNNDRAMRVYERAGFVAVKQYTSFKKVPPSQGLTETQPCEGWM